MPRLPRQKSESAIYHIMLRGISQQVIFEAEEDYLKFIETLRCRRLCVPYQRCGYCESNQKSVRLQQRSRVSGFGSSQARQIHSKAEKERIINTANQPINGNQFCNCEKVVTTQQNRPSVLVSILKKDYPARQIQRVTDVSRGLIAKL